jgi:hypothetical protein
LASAGWIPFMILNGSMVIGHWAFAGDHRTEAGKSNDQ